jgi:hypothetical protein
MTAVHEARFSEPLPDKKMLCTLCLHDCRIPTNGRGACEIGRKAGLRYVYEGNVPGGGDENTYCYRCSALLIERCGFFLPQNRIRGGVCPDCGTAVDGVDMNRE